jgi:hypothetical protein
MIDKTMKLIFHFLVIILIVSKLVAQDVDKSIQMIANNLRNHAATKEEARLLQTQFTQDDLTNKLLEALWNADSISVEAASERLLLGMDPFPFKQISELLITTDLSLKQAYLLSLLHRGAKDPEQIAATLKIAKSMLRNKGKGIRRYGEARAYSADGPRVCDIAYNILVTRLSLVPSMPPVDVDNFGTDKRDALIFELAKRESIQLKTDDRIDRDAPPGERGNSLNVPKHSPVEKALGAKPPAPDEEPTPSSTLWLVIAVLVIATTILLWSLHKRRSS